MKLEDWAKVDVNKIRERWVKRRRELEELEKKKTERGKKIEEAKKRKEEKRKRAIRERRCFVCGIFGHIACYYRIRKEKERLVWVPLNRFEKLKDRVMQRGERSGKEVVKGRREILKEEKAKKEKKEKREKKEKKIEEKDKKIEKEREVEKREEKIEKEREIEMQGFSGGEILKGRYPLV